ncbi:MAG: LysM peptidoglycan-binding domain-containing protein [Candidatus Beckwithbacteria bacterium]|nr:LysM peptidoglycan-binding domain-containing protein [Candidatus Beckwithbacteria bacterium]
MINLKTFFKSLRMNEQKLSTVLGAVVVIIVGVLIYNYFAAVNQTGKISEIAEQTTEQPKTHTVAKGEHLWNISVKYYNDGYKWTEIAKANNLANPDKIEEGQVLTLPQIENQQLTTIAESVTEQTNYPSEYTVKTSDSLWKISVAVYADGYQWSKIWEANKTKITNPDIIETGMVLTIPR